MIKVTDIAFTGYAVTDLSRARVFYESVLGLKPATVLSFENNQGWIEYEFPGGTLAVSNSWPPSGTSSTSITLEVADLEAALIHLRQKSVPVTFGPLETPVCRLAGIADPDNNGITLHQRKVAQASGS